MELISIVSGFCMFLWPFSWVRNKICCLFMLLFDQGKHCALGAATCELARTFPLIPGSCNLNWQNPATYGLCNSPYLHDSIKLGMLFVKHVVEMLWLIQHFSLLGEWDRRSIVIEGYSFSLIPPSVMSVTDCFVRRWNSARLYWLICKKIVTSHRFS